MKTTITPFMNENFLLRTKTAQHLFHDYAKKMPIFDYHCHLPPQQIAEDKRFKNITQMWLGGDHYKWRGMRSNGVSEKYCTGDASDREKFDAWAATVPHTIGNPLFHWTHLELQRYFGIKEILTPKSADSIWEKCNSRIADADFSVKPLIRNANVAALCTTDDPADSLEYHKAIANSGYAVKVLPTLRPDAATGLNPLVNYAEYLEKLEKVSGKSIGNFKELLDVLTGRVEFFHSMGCRVSDHALTEGVFRKASEAELEQTFQELRSVGQSNDSSTDPVGLEKREALATAVLLHMGREYAKRGWAMQLHYGALRNNNSRMFRTLGADTGFDSIADGKIAEKLGTFLDALDSTNELPKTIIYILNPADNEVIGTMIGNFQDGSVPGKIQFGSGWWFNDQLDGMVRQMTALASLGLLSRFVGMLTDSRSFLSYPRHEYFRRILCNLIGEWVETGQAPEDYDILAPMVKDICYNNAVRYFGIEGLKEV